MHNVDWNKLQPYSGDTKKSFEELCYQIVSEIYKEDILKSAVLTSVDDSGGGDGVEFYLTFKNGDVYGWQAKFFCRLSEGGRKEQIKKSLQTAYEKHPTLKKWFLCSQCNFTPDEKTWFDETLETSTKDTKRVLPEEHDVELIHWGESEILKYLKSYPAIHKFFFSEKLLTQEWFKDRYENDIQKSQIKAKYESEIHIPTNIDDAINKILGGERLAEILEKEMVEQQVEMYAKEYEEAFSKVFSEDVRDEYKNIQTGFRKFLDGKDKIIEQGIYKLQEIKKLILSKNEIELINRIEEFAKYTDELKDFLQKYYSLTESDLCKPLEYLRDEHEGHQEPKKEENKYWFDKIKKLFKKVFLRKETEEYQSHLPKKETEETRKENQKRTEARDILFGPLYSLKEYAIPSLEWCLKPFELLSQSELHISGEAGMGKTHISFSIYEDQIKNQNQPAIFVFAKDISTDLSLENQLKDNFGVPADWSFDDFLNALEISAKVNKTRIPIIIDGLNESAHWNSVWNSGLENLIIKVKKYPHIVLVTTYRTSYEDQLFPKKYFDHQNNKDWWKLKENVRGFEGLTWEAIDTYFQYYKIKLDNHSNAIGYFKHPLHLKLFCETKNPNREKEINVSFQNEDLFEVFDAYIKNSNENITSSLKDLDPKYSKSFTENKLLKISEYIWTRKTRGIPLSENVLTTNELRIFESENLLIFRNWNKQSDKEEIQFTYDLLGGYFVSKYLIKAYGKSYPLIRFDPDSWLVNTVKTSLEFFIPERGTKLLERGLFSISKKLGGKQPLLKFALSREFRNRLINKKTEHPLFDDILRTICILLIKKDEIFLFNVLKDERAKKYSIESLFEINAQYIKKNEELIKAFLKTEFLSNNNKAYLLDLAENIELDINHPLNFNLWSDFLSSLPMSERDLSWSEYIRKNHSWYGNSHFSNFVKHFEEACKKDGKLSNRVHFAAKKAMWILTTNIRKLRDEATRALYYYARKYPKEFLELLGYSLKINDPYVPERMLAVSYGLAMARQNDVEDESYKKEWLPKYGRFLFDSIFSKNAEYTTTHILARDYAKRTIDITILHHPKLFTDDEKILIQYPLNKYRHSDWEEDVDRNKGDYREGNAPIHMDFENYTIGRLIKDRNNYDSEHNEYKQVLFQIYWRIYNLGYSLEKFGEIDKRIASDSWNYSRHENAGKTDRYGKKYSWIAFYEMAGYRSDLGLLKGWNDEDEFRISDVDIDPSFPVELKQYNIFDDVKNNNFLGDEEVSPESWYDTKKDLNINDYLKIENNFGGKEKYEWILLKGNISQKNKDDQTRDVHISINAILVSNNDFGRLNDVVKNHNDYTFEYLRNTEDHYLFEGEIPWCDLMINDYSQKFRISYNYRDVNKTKKELKILNNDKELTKDEIENLKKKEDEYLKEYLEEPSGDELKIDIPFLLGRNHDNQITKKVAESLGYYAEYVDVPYIEKENDSIEIDIDTTVFENSWESYHSEIIPSGETQTPSKEICDNLGLYVKPQSSDLYNKDGEIISTTFKHGEGYDRTSTFTYIRKDYLEKYLKETNKKIVWLQWCEKRYFPNGVKKLSYGGERENTEYRTYYRLIQ